MGNAALLLTPDEEKEFLRLANLADNSKKEKPSLNTDTIILTEHGYDMMADRFNYKNRASALKQVREWLDKATYICETVDELDSRTHLYGVFVKQGLAVHINVNLSYEKVVTVIDMPLPQYPMPEVMREKVFELYFSELRKLGNNEQRLIKKTDYLIAESNAEIYPLKFQALKSSSEKRKSELLDRVEVLEHRIIVHNASIKELQAKIRQIARSMITLL